jgi:hypothetical protein
MPGKAIETVLLDALLIWRSFWMTSAVAFCIGS